MRAQEIARRLRPYIVKASESLSDTDALEAVELFDEWAVGVEYAKGKRLRYTGILYKVKQAHTSQADWTPDIATSLYEVVEEAGQGDTPDNPIPYSGNMTLYNGKYYEQYGVVYRCIGESGIALHNDLKDLVNIYVEVVS